MMLQIPSYDLWWTVSAIFGVIGIVGFCLLFGALVAILRSKRDN